MGFIQAGVPSTRHKRERKLSYSKPVFSNVNGYVTIKKLKLPKPKTDPQGKVHLKLPTHSKVSTLGELPPEILQHIFVLVGNDGYYSMVYLNSYFHRVLKPTPHLIGLYFMQNYMKTVHLEDHRYLIVNANMYKNNLLFRFFLRHVFMKFMNSIHGFVSETDYTNNVIEEPHTKLNINNMVIKDYGVFFDFPLELAALSRFITIGNIDTCISDIINWHFEKFDFTKLSTDKITKENIRLMYSIKILLQLKGGVDAHASIDSPDPLVVMMNLLQTQFNLKIRQYTDEQTLKKKKSKLLRKMRKIIEPFIAEFYSHIDSKTHLSHPELWNLLHRIADIALIDLVTDLGGNPQYDLFF
ncbi:hypothetical protein TPHA_0L01270 [Tetrapisispora phaffii CBS 4417]|uniref:Uncharacterized protein n=1 Tax=Tetrapisispora phaffii (strain ATCC 24235 / CBS 4417 / NBRC 1672 / NRRL Y-8282 / UCD 70-5) TaxID=1071381 RepID=G8C006_TETPH|nr:hypothetical protein TPHA_0L01270 [Tetrapisispora phaffii CBS 4417]CCE65484.1 hypothetical protein TPHA_0L01270 [Tetrapisispora phaffii CBS 4417]